MWRTTLRNVLAHKLRLALSGLAIVLGVAFVSGTMVFTDTLSKTFDDLFAATSADVTVAPRSAFVTGIEGGATDATLPAALVDRITAVDGVAAAQGDVHAEGVYVLDPEGQVLATGGAPGIGISWDTDERLSATTLTGGRAPTGPDEIALDEGAAEEAGYALGDRVTVLTPGPRVEATLVGVFRFGKSGGVAGASLTAFDTATAQELLAEPGRFHTIDVLAEDGVTHDAVRDRVASAVGADYEVKTQEEQAAELSASLEEGLRFISIFLLVFAGIALFVGSFLILNTFSMLVAQRTRELALLRALGASRAQVTRSVLAEALVLGVVGSTVGLVAGLGIAAGLRALFGRFGLTLDGSLVFTADTVLWSYVVGVLVTLLAAYLPARRASRTAPVAAMRDEPSAPERALRVRTVLGAALAVAGGAALVAGALSDDGGSGASLVGLGAVGLMLGAIALNPVLATPFVRVVGGLLPRVWGRTGHLARENALRNPRRTAATASALMVGLALVSAFSILGVSADASVDKMVDDALGADYVVSTAVGQPFTPQVAQRIAEVDGVHAVMQQRYGVGEFDGEQSWFTASDPAALDATLELHYLSGSTAGLADGGLLVDEGTAQDRGWGVGDEVEVLLSNGEERTLTVGGVFAANEATGSMVVGLDTYTGAGGPEVDNYVYVDVADSADAAAVRASLQDAVAPFPVVTLKDQGEFKDEIKGNVQQLLTLINALLVLSVLIAVLGIVNTLALSVIERTREIGLLRAIGMERSQLRRMVRLESVVISVYGATLGLVLGVAFGTGLVRALAAEGLEVLSVPAGRLLLFLAVAAVIGVLAAVWPARRAARLKVLDAIATT